MPKKSKTTQVNTQSGAGKKVNPWLEHVKQFRSEHPELSYKEVLTQAKATYTKKSA
tara:strand:+ start:201 stop:368 length:168 start_codon:yes stop_codon:yes gene_type:complete